MDRGRRRFGALCRPAACRFRRRSGSGQAAARRPHPRRQPELGQAAAARGIFARRSVFRHAGPERRDRHPPSAGRARRRAERQYLGDARRRHAARHRGAARQGLDRAVSRHRRYAMVGSAAVRHFRRNAQTHRRACRQPRPRPTPANAQSKNAHELVPATHVLDGFGSFIAPPPTARPVPVDFSGSATADHPPGFYGPPESLLAVNTLAADRSPCAARFLAARQCHARNLPHRRAAGSARTDLPRGAGAVAARYAGRAFPRRRHCSGCFRAPRARQRRA